VLFHITIRNINQVLFIILSITHWESTLTYSPKVSTSPGDFKTYNQTVDCCLYRVFVRDTNPPLHCTQWTIRPRQSRIFRDFHNNTYIQPYIDLIVASLTPEGDIGSFTIDVGTTFVQNFFSQTSGQTWEVLFASSFFTLWIWNWTFEIISVLKRAWNHDTCGMQDFTGLI
jgi:hypothetical protein